MTEWDNSWSDDDPLENVDKYFSLADMCEMHRAGDTATYEFWGGYSYYDPNSDNTRQRLGHRITFILTE